jgi:16S rRNA (cytosine1402-N4)-methyltransferase
MRQKLAEQGVDQADGIMLDLGVSSFQLDEGERGFSFHEEARLDMRMDRSQGESAYDLVNSWPEQELADILFRYGEERYSRMIARAIVRRRAQQPIVTTTELADIIRSAVPAKYRREKHPARRSFQGLRLAVNQELEALQEALLQGVELLKPGGRFCVITFHSLEDRMVKRFFQEQAVRCTCPPDFPVCVCHRQAVLKLFHGGGVIPKAEECDLNPRARSARLRIAEKI